MKHVKAVAVLAPFFLASLSCAHQGTTAAAAAPAPAPKAAPAAAAPAVVATIDGQPVTEAELDNELGTKLLSLHQQEYQLKSDALKEIVFRRLEQEAAKKAGLTVEAFDKANVADKVAEPSEEEIKQVLDRYRTQLPKEDAKAREQVVAFLKSQNLAQREAAFRDELMGQADVKILLTPPRADVRVAATDPTRGPADAPVTVIEFSDFQCPYCSRSQTVLSELRAKYGDKIRWVFKQLPLPMHANARHAAEASLCANDQGKFWELHDWMFAHQNELTDEAIKGEAKTLGLDAAKFDACLTDKVHAKTIGEDTAEAQAVGINGTPGFLINGRLVVGAQPLSAFTEIIDDELARAGVKEAKTAAE